MDDQAGQAEVWSQEQPHGVRGEPFARRSEGVVLVGGVS
jgi:hypothetical protein